MSDGATGYTAYQHTGWGAKHGEKEKRKSWGAALKRRREWSTRDIEFIPFSLEAGGVWGPAAKSFSNSVRPRQTTSIVTLIYIIGARPSSARLGAI